ncbi:MAG TPA: hypothetical protein VG939_11670 [Caulobacteraceae bacterium]|nr:hypothetical protein [Caulobacteraceae bacterium]
MQTYARVLFWLATLFNTAVGLFLAFAPEPFAATLDLQPVEGTNRLFAALCAGFILIFGYVYARIALDPVRFRPFIGLGAGGKIFAVAIMAWLWARHVIGWKVPALASGDLVLALLFVDYLRRTAPGRAGA